MMRYPNQQKPGYLNHKVVYVIGEGDEKHRAVVLALAESGADIVIGGRSHTPQEFQLHSLANEVWAMGRRAIVVPLDEFDDETLAWAVAGITSEFGHADLIVRCEPAPEVTKDADELQKASFGGVDQD
jgi:7-alpha-hydroxysteroid dehydrogenase